MSSPTRSPKTRTRKNAEDLVMLGGATVVAMLAIVELGAFGLAAGSVLLSLTAAAVVRREVGTHDPADVRTTDERIAADGGREE